MSFQRSFKKLRCQNNVALVTNYIYLYMFWVGLKPSSGAGVQRGVGLGQACPLCPLWAGPRWWTATPCRPTLLPIYRRKHNIYLKSMLDRTWLGDVKTKKPTRGTTLKFIENHENQIKCLFKVFLNKTWSMLSIWRRKCNVCLTGHDDPEKLKNTSRIWHQCISDSNKRDKIGKIKRTV